MQNSQSQDFQKQRIDRLRAALEKIEALGDPHQYFLNPEWAIQSLNTKEEAIAVINEMFTLANKALLIDDQRSWEFEQLE